MVAPIHGRQTIDPGALQLGVKIEFRAGHFGRVRRDCVVPGTALTQSKLFVEGMQ
jgi:hypothetical protein